jgi:UMF1 family MFS transporter
VRPEPGSLAFALIAVAIASFGFELALVFYNAMLLQVAPQRLLGRVSGWGWAAGYAGGLLCLALSLVLFVQADPPPFGLDMAAAEPVRIAGPLVALWFALFALPLFFFVPDRKPTGRGFADAASVGMLSLWATLRQVRRYGNAARFLLAQMLYLDGLHTLFVFGGIYAAGSFGMGFDEILIFGVLLNVASGIGAVAFAWVDDRFGSKPTSVIGLLALIALGIAILLVTDKTWFYVLAVAIGIFLGPVQTTTECEAWAWAACGPCFARSARNSIRTRRARSSACRIAATSRTTPGTCRSSAGRCRNSIRSGSAARSKAGCRDCCRPGRKPALLTTLQRSCWLPSCKRCAC